ncbi:SGNH/GDSL hydrolase family protein [Streptomyces xantholiticus]|uniref:SGNH/GDSL hydrolase family protein n=1 Tax=Streptomyces xantholiticus TaxID=68285 RepID=UPI00167ADF23|nr:SGNH/GDSL hydrolase family protein [Streptomyces xantholiticus]GGW70581.1 SGNH hydrolase [Streptomyces xantholiticus]
MPPTSTSTSTTDQQRTPVWTAVWTAAPQAPSTGFTPNWSQEGFSHQTVRQIVRVTAGGDRLRIRLSNAYGTSPLHLTGATVARSTRGAAVMEASVRHLTFGGRLSASVPARAERRSDPVEMAVGTLGSVAVTLHFAGTTGPATFHAQAWADTYRADGDHRADPSAAAFTGVTQSWYYLCGVEVDAGRTDGIVLFGDSITDGFGSTPGANRRWSDALAELTGRPVLNAGIGGNLVLNDSAWYGERATARFHRDVLEQPGVSTVVVLEGLNDIGFSEAPEEPTYKPAPLVSAAQVVGGYRQLIRQAHSRGLRVVGATLLPLGGSDHWGAHSARVGKEINDWIRTSGEFDAVVGLDRALADPADPDRLHPAFDHGDRLHPNDKGYQVMAEALADVL